MTQVIPVVHAHSHNDGAQAIVKTLGLTGLPLVYGGHDVRHDWHLTESNAMRVQNPKVNGVYTLEGPFPMTAAELCAVARIPVSAVTSVLLLVDALTCETDPFGALLRTKIAENGQTALGLGNVWSFDPESRDADSFDALGDKTKRLISYLEGYLRVPVRWIATSPETAFSLSGTRRL